MSSDRDAASAGPQDEMLPDEREAIVERLDSLADEESQLTVEEVAADLGIDLEDSE